MKYSCSKIKYIVSTFLFSINCIAMQQNNSVQYAQASESDLPGVKKLIDLVWIDTYTRFYSRNVVDKTNSQYHTVEYLMSQLVNPNIYFLLAKNSNQQVVGVITTEKYDNNLARIIRLYVHAEYRNKGVGAQLIERTLNHFKDVETIKVDVKEQNLRALAFYKRYGFIPKEKEEAPLFDEVAMNLVLYKGRNS